MGWGGGRGDRAPRPRPAEPGASRHVRKRRNNRPRVQGTYLEVREYGSYKA